MSELINKYRIYCTTDNKWEYIWDTSAPTTCPVNGVHTVNANSVSILGNVKRIQDIDTTASPYTITGYNFYRANTTSGAITINLKPAAENKDRVIIFQNISGINTLTIDGNAAETIGGSATASVTGNKGMLKIQSNGSNWVVLEIRTTDGDNLLDGTLYADNFDKGDVIVNNGLDTTAISGADNTFLKADSTQASGLVFVTETVLGDSNVAASAGINVNKLADGSVSNTEFQYINSVTSNVQDQLDVMVDGPVSATDNAVVRFDGTTGKLAQNSGVLIDDSNNVTGLFYLEVNDLSAPANPGAGKGRIYKKTGNDGIWWKPDAAGPELDLTVASTLTAAEVTQLENIDTTTISSTQWGYLGTTNQAIATTDAVTFNGVTSTAVINMSSNKITNLATPTVGTDAANKSYVDSVAQGLDIKNSARVATTVAGTLASSFENGDVIDGVTLVTGDKILIKNQVTGSENGIYEVAASGAPTRALDLQVGASGASVFTFIEEGTVNKDSGWVCTSDVGADVVGTDSLIFVQFSGAGQIIAGDGLLKTGNTLDVRVDTTSIVISSDILEIKNAPTSKGELLTFNATEQASLAASGTNNYVLVADSTQATGLKWAEVPIRSWIFQDVKTTGTFGGTATGDSTWRKRTLNTTVVNGGSEVTLATDQLTLAAGSYHIRVKSSFYKTQGTRIRLQNITDTSTLAHSINSWASDLNDVAINADIEMYVNLGASKVYEVQYACDRTQSNDGLGIPSGISGVSEIYTNIVLTKL